MVVVVVVFGFARDIQDFTLLHLIFFCVYKLCNVLPTLLYYCFISPFLIEEEGFIISILVLEQ